eukprot:snap_masked-scaffold_31-processed-gene-3.31-mRNA-1 protein AED:1.00 eAED:1.00 QI:0/0/0/0/1/1/2/0/71
METESSADVVKILVIASLNKTKMIMLDGITMSSAQSNLRGSKRMNLTPNLRVVLTGSFHQENELDQLIENM